MYLYVRRRFRFVFLHILNMKFAQAIIATVALFRGIQASCDGVQANQLINHLEQYNQHLSNYASLGSKVLEVTASQSTAVSGKNLLGLNLDVKENQNHANLADLHSQIQNSYHQLKDHQTQLDTLASGCIPLSRQPKVFTELFNMMSTYLIQQRNLVAAGNLLAQPEHHKRDEWSEDAWPAAPTVPGTTTTAYNTAVSTKPTITISWEINGTPISELTAKNTDTTASTDSSLSPEPSTTSVTATTAADWDDTSYGTSSDSQDTSSTTTDDTPTSTSTSKKPNIFQRIINGTEDLLKDALHLVERILHIGGSSSESEEVSALVTRVANRYNIKI